MRLPSHQDLPLQGRMAVVVASPEKAEKLKEGLRRLGADILPVQVSVLRRVEDPGLLDAALQNVAQYRWILFTSSHGAWFFFQRMTELGLAHLRTELQGIGAIGPATADKLESLGFRVTLVPDEFDSEGVLRALAAEHGGAGNLRGLRILLPRAREGRDLLPRELGAAGALVDSVPCYESIPTGLDEETRQRITSRTPDLLVFTSPSNVKNFVSALGPEPGRVILTASTVAAIGPVTAETVASYGRAADIVPTENTTGSLLLAVREYFGSLSARK
jgi:uroporphyrinogen III methyltransferase/synthase